MLPAGLLPCFVATACLTMFPACATKSPIGGRYVVSTHQTSFYKYGPAQTLGPDFSLPKGARVTMLQNSWGFARVMTDDGTAGYVSSDDLEPAPPEQPPPAATSSHARPPSSSKPKHSNVSPTPGSPLFEAGDLPPLPSNAEPPKPAPGFRF